MTTALDTAQVATDLPERTRRGHPDGFIGGPET